MDRVASQENIDIVITWVDGNDPEHKQKKRQALKKLKQDEEKKKSALLTGWDKTRFQDNGELYYCLQSIKKFAPWVRKVHLVTDNQIPDFLTETMKEDLKLNIVDHRDIFEGYEAALPTFNARTIETALWRIPDLAEKFLYMNDDFAFAAPVQPDCFFDGDRVILPGNWSPIRSYGPVRIKLNDWFSIFTKKVLGITRSMHLLLQMKSAQRAGFTDKYFRADHLPHPVRTETLKQFFTEHEKAFRDNIKYRFRNKRQFSAIFLARHLEIAIENAELKPVTDFVMINGETDPSFVVSRKLDQIRSGSVRYVCIQGFEILKEKMKKKTDQTFRELLHHQETAAKQPTSEPDSIPQ